MSYRHPRALQAVALVAISVLAGCATVLPAADKPASSTATGAALAPNANLLVQGIPPIPLSLVERVERYTDFRGHAFADWHPTRPTMLVSHRRAGANTAQLFLIEHPLDAGRQLTDGADPVSRAAFEPREGRYIVFERSAGGSEVDQLYRLALDGGEPVLLTDRSERHAMNVWLKKSGTLTFTSVPLDSTAQGGSRARIDTTLWAMDPQQPQLRRKLAVLPGGGWSAGRAAPDESQLALTQYISANESRIWILDLRSGELKQLLPRVDEALPAATHAPAAFSQDGKTLFILSDRFSEFRELAALDLASGKLTRMSSHIPWNIGAATLSADGRRLAVQANVDGRDELRLFDTQSLAELPKPTLPPGNVGSSRFHPAQQQLAFSVSNAQGPSQIYSLDPASGSTQAWTRAYSPPGLDPSRFAEQQIVRWKSFDGLDISGLLTVPDRQRFPGKRPVLVAIHGGPESQATMGFMARYNYFINELGIALIQPNVRGSSGYGKRFLALDNGYKREDSVKDIGALFDWIATQPELDASRVLVMGGSYGGYMTLAVATHYADRIAGAIDIVGISHFVTFLNNTESYRRDLRRVEYGDERDPAMREFLDRISPLTNAHKIKKPLFVVQGKNDPRVPYTEAEQIVAKVRENGTPVWYLRAENEGHGFARKENADYQFYATILFMQQTLLK